MDEADRAQANIESDLERRIAAARGQCPSAEAARTDCADCGEQIEPARVALGYDRCFECAEDRERLVRLGGFTLRARW